MLTRANKVPRKKRRGTIAEGLREVGLTVEVQAARDVDSLDDYDFVVLGTAVKGEDVPPEAAEFMEKWRTELRGKPAAYLALSMLMADPTDENRKHVAAVLNKLLFEQRPWDLGIFGGVRDPEKMSMVLRWSVKQSKVPVGDFRDPAGDEGLGDAARRAHQGRQALLNKRSKHG